MKIKVQLHLKTRPLFKFSQQGTAGQAPSTDPTLTTMTFTTLSALKAGTRVPLPPRR